MHTKLARASGICLALISAAVLAEEGAAQVSGHVDAGVRWETVDGINPYRYNEYRDLGSGVVVEGDLTLERDAVYVNIKGGNIGYEDQFVGAEGGAYGAYKFFLYNDRIVHRLTENAQTIYSGSGTDVLRLNANVNDISTWSPLEYEKKIDKLGGGFELSFNSPWFLRFEVNESEANGKRPIGGSAGGFGPVIEMPAPIDYTTTNYRMEAGFSDDDYTIVANGSRSQFRNRFDFLTWERHSAPGNFKTTSLPPDNTYDRLGLSAVVKRLPMNTTVSARLSHEMLSNPDRIAVGSEQFEGDATYTTFSGAVTSMPARGLDLKAYLNWYERDDDSPVVTAVSGSTIFHSEPLSYDRWVAGAEIGYRLNRGNKLTAGYEFQDMERTRLDYDHSAEHKAFVQWRNSSLEDVTTKVKYQYLVRNSDFLLADAGADSGEPEFLNRYIARFDVADLQQHQLRLGADWTPLPMLDLGAEYIYRRNDFPDTVLGRTDETRDELYLSAAAGDPERLRVTAFFDWEKVRYKSTHRSVNTSSAGRPLGCYDPLVEAFSAAGCTQAFNWRGSVHDNWKSIGVMADWVVNERFRLNGSVVWQDANGDVDFNSRGDAVGAATPVRIDEYDDYYQWTLGLSGRYAYTRQWNFTLGYLYERLRYGDVQLDGYQLLPGGNNVLSGAYADPDYDAHVVYFVTRYTLP